MVRPSLSSSDPPERLWELSLGEFAVLTPTVQFPIAPRRLQRRQRQHPLRRPAHPPVLATVRHRPVVELLHPRARDPSPHSLPFLVVGDVPATFLQIPDQVLHPFRGP